MKFGKMLAGIILALSIAAASFIFMAKGTHAEDQAVDQQAAVLAKLDQVLESQKAIMGQLDVMKQELNIIKVRITQAQ